MTNQKPALIDRVLRVVTPTPVRSFAPPPRHLSDNLCVIERQLRMPGALIMPTRMTLIRLPSGGLVLLSPIELRSDVAAALRSLGPVEAIVAPNSFHYLFAADYLAAFSGARLFVAPGLPVRVPSLPTAILLTDEPAPLWTDTIDQCVFEATGGISEVMFFVRPDRTLMLTDIAFNLRRIDGLYNRVAWRLMGVPRRFGPSRSARLTLFRDPAVAGPFLKRMLAWDFRRIIVAHGEIIEHDGQGEVRRAFARYLR